MTSCLFFFNATATTEIYTLSLHDALPICNPDGLRSPSFQNWDIALFKNFPLGGSRRMQFRLEAFNFINHPNLGNPAGGSPYGVVIDPGSADFGRVLTKTSERNVQLGVKFSF